MCGGQGEGLTDADTCQLSSNWVHNSSASTLERGYVQQLGTFVEVKVCWYRENRRSRVASRTLLASSAMHRSSSTQTGHCAQLLCALPPVPLLLPGAPGWQDHRIQD
jgi:hypothetical protein